MTIAVSNPLPKPKRSPLIALGKNLGLILLGVIIGLGVSRFIKPNSSSTNDLLATQNQVAASLKSLHDKLSQIEVLTQSVTTLTQDVQSLNQTLSLTNDLSSLSPPAYDPTVLGTASASLLSDDLYPSSPISPAAIGGNQEVVLGQTSLILNPQKTSETNLYTSPSNSAKIVGRVTQKESFTPIKNLNGWYLVRLNDNQEGWLSAQLVLPN